MFLNFNLAKGGRASAPLASPWSSPWEYTPTNVNLTLLGPYTPLC